MGNTWNNKGLFDPIEQLHLLILEQQFKRNCTIESCSHHLLKLEQQLKEGRVLWKVVLRGSGTNYKSEHNHLLKNQHWSNHGCEESWNGSRSIGFHQGKQQPGL